MKNQKYSKEKPKIDSNHPKTHQKWQKQPKNISLISVMFEVDVRWR